MADLQAGRADNFVLVWGKQAEGNSIKWSGDPTTLNWGELIGADGLLKELADGWKPDKLRVLEKFARAEAATERPRERVA